ncbi:MAG: peptidylprolyl isomerase [Cocleimonas sp.]
MMIINTRVVHALITKHLISLMLFLSFLGATAHAEDIALDKIIAIVNNDVVMFSEVRSVALRYKQSGQRKLSEKELIKEILDKIILEKIQLQRAKDVGINIDDAAINKAMASIAEQNKLSLTQFKVALTQEGHGYQEFRDNLRDRLYIDALQKNHRRGRQKITESAVDDLIRAESLSINKETQYHLLDVLVPAANGISVPQFNRQLKKAQLLRKQLIGKSATSIPTIIKKMGASQKDLGWKKSQSLSPAYVRTLSLMGVGELSDIVRDPAGFHILKLIEQRGGVRKITQQAKVRHILIPTTNPQAKLKATQLRNKILAGGNFAKLAQDNSADKGSAQQGGDLGLTDPASFVPPFAKAVISLPLNTLSQPIQTRFGWHLIEVLERKATDQTREALKVQAEAMLNKKNQSNDTKNWLQGLRDQAYVEYRL